MKIGDLPLQFPEPKCATAIEVGGVGFELAEAHVSAGIVIGEATEQPCFGVVGPFVNVFPEAGQPLLERRRDPLLVIFG